METLRQFSAVWVIDFEFCAPRGERPRPICMVAREVFTGRKLRLWADQMAALSSPPFATGRDILIVTFYASAEMGCFLANGWQLPANILDLFVEFRRLTNGRDTLAGNGLIGALIHHGLRAIDAIKKDEMRQLAMRGGPFDPDEKRMLLDYCESDVDSTTELLSAMLPAMNLACELSRALLRGRYMKAVARMEWDGIPIDRQTLDSLRVNWKLIQKQLIEQIDVDYGVFDGTSFKRDRFSEWLIRTGTPWLRLPSGELAMDDRTFRQMAKIYPSVAPLRELRHSLGELRLEDLSVGHDDRNRCLISPFSSTTSRNQPSNSKFIFGPSRWMRGLIKPPPGRAIAYIDWSQQEFAIAAALSSDEAMKEAYRSADPYLTFAKQARAVPEWATKQSHAQQREQFKSCALGVQYGMQSRSLAQTLGQSEALARQLLDLHRRTYPTYWKWSQAAVDHAMIHGYLDTVFRWRVHVGSRANPRGMANFPMQGNGAEMLRIACCLATEQGIMVCAPIHDALLIEGDVDSIGDAVSATQQCMLQAGKIVLDGFSLRTDAVTVQWPDRYMDGRGEKMWSTAMGILNAMRSDFAFGTTAPMQDCPRIDADPSNLLFVSSMP